MILQFSFGILVNVGIKFIFGDIRLCVGCCHKHSTQIYDMKISVNQ